MKKLFKSKKITIIAVIIGAIIGYLYWKNIGCSNGKCLLKSNPYYMTMYGGILGGLIVNLFKK